MADLRSVSELTIVGLPPEGITPAFESWLAEHPVAGFLLFRNDYETLEELPKLAQRLRAQGADVTLTRQSDLTLELANRAYLCNISGADIAISVHLNGVDNRAINGALALHGKASDVPLAEAMAGVMQSGLFGTARADTIDFGARHFGARVLLYTTMPAVLVEPAFLTNPAEARSLLDAGAPASVPALPERTLLVHGEDDDLVPATHSTRLSTEATVEIVPGMGHFPMLDPGREHWPLVVAELGKTRSPVASELPPLSTDR